VLYQIPIAFALIEELISNAFNSGSYLILTEVEDLGSVTYKYNEVKYSTVLATHVTTI
jgi:hypothetical protein